MKRLVCLAALTAILSIGVTAFAEDTETFTFPAEYIGGTSDTASVNAADYSTGETNPGNHQLCRWQQAIHKRTRSI